MPRVMLTLLPAVWPVVADWLWQRGFFCRSGWRCLWKNDEQLVRGASSTAVFSSSNLFLASLFPSFWGSENAISTGALWEAQPLMENPIFHSFPATLAKYLVPIVKCTFRTKAVSSRHNQLKLPKTLVVKIFQAARLLQLVHYPTTKVALAKVFCSLLSFARKLGVSTETLKQIARTFKHPPVILFQRISGRSFSACVPSLTFNLSTSCKHICNRCKVIGIPYSFFTHKIWISFAGQSVNGELTTVWTSGKLLKRYWKMGYTTE